MNTYALDPSSWDMSVDSNGNFAVVSGQSQISQDVASSIRAFLGESWYDTSLGMPYFQSIFGQSPSSSFMRAQIVRCALNIATVTGATVAQLFIKNRQLTGTVLVTTSTSPSPITVTF